MSQQVETDRTVVTLARVAAAVLAVLSVATYVAFDDTACPGDGGPDMAEASAQAIVCGGGDFYPWALLVWIVTTVGGLAAMWWAVNRMRGERRRVAVVLLPLVVPLVLSVVLRLPSESCTDEVKRTEPAERCIEPD